MKIKAMVAGLVPGGGNGGVGVPGQLMVTPQPEGGLSKPEIPALTGCVPLESRNAKSVACFTAFERFVLDMSVFMEIRASAARRLSSLQAHSTNCRVGNLRVSRFSQQGKPGSPFPCTGCRGRPDRPAGCNRSRCSLAADRSPLAGRQDWSACRCCRCPAY